MTSSTNKTHDLQTLDALTGGAFTAATSGERAARIRDWLAGSPATELLQEVFRELSLKDKGAARPVRERLDELRRAKGQEALAAEWAAKAEALLSAPRIHVADAMAWQRDAARAGAPLSREPLAGLKTRLAERIKAVEDLQTQSMVLREAAVLLAQRIEVLSTKSWQEAQAAAPALSTDVAHWNDQISALTADAGWASVDARHPAQIEASRQQLSVVWLAFGEAVELAVQAAADPAAPLPPVPVWADELRAARGEATAAPAERPGRPAVDPAAREAAQVAVRELVAQLETELAEGHGKASVGVANALRAALKEHGKLVDHRLEAQAQSALSAAGELEGWQRWRADQLRRELVGKAEALLRTEDGPEGPVQVPVLGGRKLQETLRQLREQWKAADHGGPGNHALWRRFDEACTRAHKFVEAWVDKARAESAEHRAQRLALIEEVKAFAARATADGTTPDWKAHARTVHQFSERWRQAGHLSEKAFAEIQPVWKAAIHAAAEPLEQAQKGSIERRQALIAEAVRLGEAPGLRVDAVKDLQHRWQVEAQSVPLDRKLEQKLWDAFRKPIDEAFQRKSAERQKSAVALSEHDSRVLEAARALEAASARGDAQAIRAAMQAMEQALRSPSPGEAAPDAQAAPAAGMAGDATGKATDSATDASADGATAAAETPPPRPARPVVAMRGDDRPGMKKAEPAAPVRGGRPGDRRGPARPDDRRFGAGDRPGRDDRAQGRGPRLGDAAFRAQRDALEHAQAALRRLAAQAHGESITQLLQAWAERQADQLPSASELGRAVSPAARSAWVRSLSAAPSAADAQESLLRLEMAAEVPTPAEHIAARRALQLQLLTKRHAPAPAQTWGEDVAQVLAGPHEAGLARRLQAALKVLLRA